MRMLVIGSVLGALVISLAACGGSSSGSASEQDTKRQADLYAIGQIEKTFHKGMSKKDIDLFMSIWAPDATFTGGPGRTMAGKAQIRDHWLATKPFQPGIQWVSETPAYKIRATVDGDRGTLYFECHFVDVRTRVAEAISAADAQVARIDGRWLITNLVGASATLSP